MFKILKRRELVNKLIRIIWGKFLIKLLHIKPQHGQQSRPIERAAKIKYAP